MGENSKIEWCHHTFNPWVGCQKVSPGCDRCYAEGWAKRSGQVQWGPHAPRRLTSDANWRKPLRWNADAAAAGVRRRVFCASLADWLDNRAPPLAREKLAARIEETPWLDWLLLSKRPENYRKLAPQGWQRQTPDNVWLGITAEDHVHYDARYKFIGGPDAPQTPVRFISYEPALGWLRLDWAPIPRVIRPDWLICGGESGHGARMMDVAWARLARDICIRDGIAFFMKQMTGKAPIPADLQIRQFPEPRRARAAA